MWLLYVTYVLLKCGSWMMIGDGWDCDECLGVCVLGWAAPFAYVCLSVSVCVCWF